MENNQMPMMDNSFMWFILLIFLLGGGNMFGKNNQGIDPIIEAVNNNGTITRQEMAQGFTNQDMFNNLRNISDGMVQGFNGVNENIVANRYAMQNCCCELKTAIHSEGETTRALITQNAMQDLRDRLADKDRELATANMQLSNMAQSQNIIGTLRPFPQPAYLTASPYQALGNGTCPCTL